MISLITGASGFLGSHLTRLLVQQGEQVRVLVRPGSETRALAGLPVERVGGDLRDASSLAAAVQGVQRVFHVAADYRLWTPNPQEIYDSNVAGTRHLLEAARRAGVEKFVYTSSVATLAVPRGDDLPDERTQARLEEMIGHYKRSKFLAEREVLAAARDGLPAVVVNPSAPVGPGDWKPTPTGQLVLDFLRGRMVVRPPAGGLNLVPVEDVARGHVLALERGRPGERYLLAGENLTLDAVWELLAGICGRPVPRLRIPYAAALGLALGDELRCRAWRGARPAVPLEGVRMSRHPMYVDGSRAAEELGLGRVGPVARALAGAVAWYRANGFVG